MQNVIFLYVTIFNNFKIFILNFLCFVNFKYFLLFVYNIHNYKNLYILLDLIYYTYYPNRQLIRQFRSNVMYYLSCKIDEFYHPFSVE